MVGSRRRGRCDTVAEGAEAIVVALKSRTAPTDEAVAGSLGAHRWLKSVGAQQIVFKYCSTFDSTPMGNIGPVADALLDEAARLQKEGFSRIVVAGGETSGAVSLALGVRTLRIGAEIAPGVPWCEVVGSERPLAVALKSGNFGGPTFFRDAFGMLP